MENVVPSPVAASSVDDSSTSVDTTVDVPPLEDGYGMFAHHYTKVSLYKMYSLFILLV